MKYLNAAILCAAAAATESGGQFESAAVPKAVETGPGHSRGLPRWMSNSQQFDPATGLGLENHGLSMPGEASGAAPAAPASPSAPVPGGFSAATLAAAAAMLAASGATQPAPAAPGNTAPVAPVATMADFHRQNTERVAAIAVIMQGFERVPAAAALHTQALADVTMTPDQFRAKLLPVIQSALPPVGALSPLDISMGATGWERQSADLATNLMLQLMPRAEALVDDTSSLQSIQRGEKVARALGYETAAAARVAFSKFRSAAGSSLNFQAVAEQCVEAGARGRGGQRWSYSRGGNAFIEAAFSHSTSDLPALMRSTMGRTLQASMAVVDTTYQLWTGTAIANDFRAREEVRSHTITLPTQLVNGRTPKESVLADGYETLGLETIALKLSIDRKTLINDDLGGIAKQIARIGVAFELKKEIDAITALNAGTSTTLTDGTAFFHSTRGNIGSNEALSYANWLAATTAMMKKAERTRNNDNGSVYLNVAPKILFVPTTLWATANELCRSEKLPSTGEANTNRDNIVRRRWPQEDISSPYQDNQSTTRWYMLADPAICPAVVISYLNGNKVPIVSPISNGSALGMEWEVIHDVKADLLNPEGAYRNGSA